MSLAFQQNASSPWRRWILHGMLLLAVLASLPVAMVVAAMGAWYALQAGSLV